MNPTQMPRRKQLKNVACGIARRFSSRNNDIDGYWALGLLYSTASAAATNSIRLDLMSETAVPSLKHTGRVVSQFKQYLRDQLENINLTNCLSAATVEVEFNVEPQSNNANSNSLGDRFRCCVTLTDDHGKDRKGYADGFCRQHDATRESRSTRAYAS